MKRIAILKNVAYATKIGGGTLTVFSEVNQLADGAIAFFTDNNRFLSAANVATVLATEPDTEKVWFAVGTGSATIGAKLSGMIDRRTARVVSKLYTAPVKEIQYIGEDAGGTGDLNLPSPLVVGTSAIIHVIDESAGTQPPIRKKTYEEVVRTGDTIATIITRLIAQNTADTVKFVTLTVVGAAVGIKVAVDDYGVKISLAVDGIFANADIEKDGTGSSVSINVGTGTPTQIAALEYECNPVEGDTNRYIQPAMWFSKPSDVDTAAVYDMIWIDWLNTKTRDTGSQVASNTSICLAIAGAGSSITKANLNTMFVEMFGNETTSPETGGGS